MATIESRNFAFQDPSEEEIPDGSTILSGSNFTQAVPDTPIMAGRTLTIDGGNFRNVRRDPAWTGGKRKYPQTSFCANLHPEWVKLGVLAPCVENCDHVVETIDIAGSADVVYVYQDTKLASQ